VKLVLEYLKGFKVIVSNEHLFLNHGV